MKKLLLGFFAALSLFAASCGEKLLTEAQVQEEIQKGVDARRMAVENEMTQQCDSEFETRVTAKLDSMKMAAQNTTTVQ